MKLLIINYEYPPLGGGAGNATANIARELAALGHEPFVLTAGFAGLPERESPEGFPVLCVRSRRARIDRSNPLEMLDFLRKADKALPKMLDEFMPDAVIAFFALPSGLLAYKLSKRYGIPYTISLRGGDVPGFLPRNLRLLHALSAPFTRAVWKHASRIIANSKGLEALAEKTALPLGKSVECVPNGIDTKLYQPRPEMRDRRFTLLFVGRLTEQKGVTFLLKACAELLSRNPLLAERFRCVIVGDGPLSESLRAQSEALGLGTLVEFTGWRSRAAIIESYQSAHAFALPSFEEGMPNVVLEAMASGLPIIATDVKGNDELVETDRNGFLYRSHAELAGLIERLMDDPALALRFGQESRRKAEAFTWKRVAEAYARKID
jgi:glycosyltransferase involved in cell wall biosynthesis